MQRISWPNNSLSLGNYCLSQAIGALCAHIPLRYPEWLHPALFPSRDQSTRAHRIPATRSLLRTVALRGGCRRFEDSPGQILARASHPIERINRLQIGIILKSSGSHDREIEIGHRKIRVRRLAVRFPQRIRSLRAVTFRRYIIVSRKRARRLDCARCGIFHFPGTPLAVTKRLMHFSAWYNSANAHQSS